MIEVFSVKYLWMGKRSFCVMSLNVNTFQISYFSVNVDAGISVPSVH